MELRAALLGRPAHRVKKMRLGPRRPDRLQAPASGALLINPAIIRRLLFIWVV